MSLANAFKALREGTSGPATEDAAAATRRRILLIASERSRKRLVLVRYAIPIAAVLAMGTAWAALSGRLAGTWSERGEPAAAEAGVMDAASAHVEDDIDAAVVEEDAAILELPDTPPARVAPSPPKGDPEEDLYRVAHRAHFVEHDEAASLAACNAYLAKYPDGRFAPEAQYNRALALVSLGRTAEARAALAPFASGAMGGYRQSEARALLGALRDRPEK